MRVSRQLLSVTRCTECAAVIFSDGGKWFTGFERSCSHKPFLGDMLASIARALSSEPLEPACNETCNSERSTGVNEGQGEVTLPLP
jgi:hypothetical protein